MCTATRPPSLSCPCALADTDSRSPVPFVHCGRSSTKRYADQSCDQVMFRAWLDGRRSHRFTYVDAVQDRVTDLSPSTSVAEIFVLVHS